MQPGERLGPYEIVGRIGAGGMGDVYSARDTRLGRTVAIKRTHARFSDRFEREARAISALNHPNICQLYDVGPDYLVMELVDGAPIAPVDHSRKLLDLAAQMADGLAAAHTAGIVHRDLKPDNVLVTREGRVKILDFGLATERSALLGGADASTVAGVTEPGAILGTVSYMSPEQARGQSNVGPQSDQFSLGLVLYELAAGKRAFRRNSTAETLAAIIRDDPDPLPDTTPAPLRWVIERLLAKDPSDRYDSTRDLHRELRQIRDRLSEATNVSAVVPAVDVGPHPQARRARIKTGVAVLTGMLLGASAAVLWFVTRPSGPTHDMSKYSFTEIAAGPQREFFPKWAPDGKSILYQGVVDENNVRRFQVFTKTIGSSESVQVTRAANATNPFWSPDGSLIYFLSGGALWAVASTGGAPERILDRASLAVAHPDGQTLVFARGSSLWVGRRGEAPREHPAGVLTSRPGTLVPLAFSPDGSALAYREDSRLWILPFPTGKPRQLPVDDVNDASWMPDGRRLVLNRQLASGESMLSMIDSINGHQHVFFAAPENVAGAQVSPDGTRVVYTSQRDLGDVVEVSVADGRARTLQPTRGRLGTPDWAPDGHRYLFGSDRGVEVGVAGDSNSRPIISPGPREGVDTARWSPDGTQFTVRQTGPQGIRLMIANASGRMLPLDPQAPGTTSSGVWTRDGQVIYQRTIEGKGIELARIRPGAAAAAEILATYPTGDARGRTPLAMSPDGHWILARSITPPAQLFLLATDLSRERALPSDRLGRGPIAFSTDGREVMCVYRDTTAMGGNWQLWAVDIATLRERLVTRVGLPDSVERIYGFSLHPDGTRFLLATQSNPADIWMLSGFDTR